MSLESMLFGRNSFLGKAANIMGLGLPSFLEKHLFPDAAPPRLGEISQQTAKEAEPRVIVWGRVRPIGGNMIHCQAPVKRWVKQKSSGGKGGGGSSSQKVEHVFRTYAIGVCEGPITGFSRIWRNNKLVYDARGNDWGAQNNPIFLQKYRLYLGRWDQMPSPDLESIWGVGQVPAYRGTAYMVALDEDLTDMGGAVPQWLFEVERAEGVVLTSRPYPAVAIEGVQAGPATVRPGVAPIISEAVQGATAVATGGTLRTPLVTYSDWSEEAVQSDTAVATGGTLRTPLVTYADWPEEAVQGGTAIATGGTLRDALVTYQRWPDERVQAAVATVIGGSLT